MEAMCRFGFPGSVPSGVGTSPLVDITTPENNNLHHKLVRNFAHFGDGARVLPEITSLTFGTRDNRWLYASSPARDFIDKNPPYIISDDQMGVGSCWEIEGSTGILGVLLSESIFISSISIDSIHPSLVSITSHIRNPRSITLWGMLPNSSIIPPAAAEVRSAKQFLPNFVPGPRSYIKGKDSFVPLLSAFYDAHGAVTNQHFELASDHWATCVAFQVIVVEILENWGGSTTCIYRLRVHGSAS